jgi:phosphate transport system permease protein
MASLTVFIYDYAKAPFDDWNRQAWGAAFVLIVLIFIVNITFRFVTRGRYGDHQN